MFRVIFHFIIGVISTLSILYALLWLFSVKTYPVSYGVSFNQNHAASLGLDWKETYLAILSDLNPQYIRIAAMWSEIEPEQGTYDFEDVDWMMDQAEAYGTNVLLVVGQKAPRWPECHVPSWVTAKAYEQEDIADHLYAYIAGVVQRYKDHPALELWQVENEAFINFKFGECAGFEESFVPAEVDLVQLTDPEREILLTDSGELSTWRQPSQHGDILGTTLYRTVLTPGGNTITYDWIPAGFYKLKARLWGKGYQDFFVAELQAEPWFSDADPRLLPVEDQRQLFSQERMLENIGYASHVGASRVYLWGVEWWYFMKQEHNEPAYWDMFNTLSSSLKQSR